MSDLTQRARCTRLNKKDVLDIRKRYHPHLTDKMKASVIIKLALEYNLTQESIRNIAKRKTFNWIEE